ncbi:chromatin modification- protein eaf6 [Coemansia guatemalensis]|uniref:Chromatin modification-related protein EAF6 n=1 Tax=Coemansia guatemalensis TaxID=2761395 RepID=A0A9W8I0I5_9FUNG|nr:chromatin modification- protein eaf6 [Coemansia guatemalensis]
MGAPAATATSNKDDKDNKETSTTNANGKASKAAPGNKAEGKVTKKMLKETEQELYQLLLKKKQSDRNLVDAEAAIYDFETSYFESSGHEGNVVFGFEGYLNTGRHERRQMHFTEADRIFSQSSATFKKAQEAKIAAMLDSDSDDSEIGGGRIKGRKGGGGSTIKHNRQSTPTPGPRSTKKIRLSMDKGS